MLKSGAGPKRIRRNDERRQWAAAVVKKATPKIVRSLSEAAASLEEPARTPESKPAGRAPEEHQDESLAALLLRLLRTGDNGGTESDGANAATHTGKDSPVG